jgi:hypothetical protein
MLFQNDGERHLHLQLMELDHLHLCTKEFRWVPGSTLRPEDTNGISVVVWLNQISVANSTLSSYLRQIMSVGSGRLD